MHAILTTAHQRVAAALRDGSLAVDATAGNGHDTVALARLVGPRGRVFAFDVQDEALTATRVRIEAEGLGDRVTLVHAGHETLGDALPREAQGRIGAVMFNLGYRPGGNKALVTRPDTTCRALDAAGEALAPGGVLTVVLYTGHPGGAEEARAVEGWFEALPASEFGVRREAFEHGNVTAPRLLVACRADAPERVSC